MSQTTVDLVVGLAQAFAWPAMVMGLLVAWRRPIRQVVETLQSRAFGVTAGPFALRVEQAAEALESAMKHSGRAMESADARRLLAREPRELAGLEGRRLLWVDDHPEYNREEIRVLELLGLNVQVTRSTEEALRAYQRSLFDVVVTDMARDTDQQAGLKLAQQLRDAAFAGPIFVYLMDLDHTRPTPPSITAIANRPDDLVRLIVESFAR